MAIKFFKILLAFFILPSMGYSQTWKYFAELHYSTMMQFNYIQPGATLSREQIKEYYYERLASYPSYPIKVGVEYKRHHISVFRQSDNPVIKGVFHHKGDGYHDKSEYTKGGGLTFLSTRFSTGLKYGYIFYKAKNIQVMSTVSLYYFRKIDDIFVPNSNAWGSVGRDNDQTFFKFWDSVENYYSGFRPVLGIEGQYNFSKKKAIGINLQFHFPTSQKLIERDIYVVDRQTGELHNFKHQNFGRSLEASVFFKYYFAETSFKNKRDPLGSRQRL
jgi:hypothetical protein